MNGHSSDDPVKKAGRAIGASPNELKSAALSGDLSAIFSKMTPEQAAKVKSILADENAAKKLLATPQAQALLKGFSKNG